MKSLEDNEPNDLGNVNSHTFSDFVLLNYNTNVVIIIHLQFVAVYLLHASCCP